ncbi:MAG: hypothetical protein COA59_00160 [Colwellia sp.]|nr:MAG: hypothetical protein COA59_00160 [Colwellia sp.]
MPITLIYITALILVIGAFPLPYDYYMLLRIIVTGVFIWAAVIVNEKNNALLTWVCVGVVLLFNPFIKVHLSSIVWGVIDILTAIFLISIREQLKSTKPT